jgi:hypothetical protein
MKLKALVQKPENIVRFLKHLGEPTEPPPLAPAPSGLGPTRPTPTPRGFAAPVVVLRRTAGSRAAPQAPAADRTVRRVSRDPCASGRIRW